MAQNKRWLQVRAEYLIAYPIIQLLRFLPFSLATKLANGVASALDLAVPKLRQVAMRNLSFALPEKTVPQQEEIVDGVFRSIGRLLIAVARFPDINSKNVSRWIGYEGLDNYFSAKAKGRGVLVATAHLGNWELSAFTHAFMTEPMNVMVRPLDNPLIDHLVERRRTLSGNKLIYKWEAARSVIKALKQNEAVGILIDQNTVPSEGVFIDFFGKRACATSAFVKFAHHAKAPVVPGFALWDERTKRYILRFYPQLELTGDLNIDTQSIHSIFEGIIREHPDQWMWIHRRWKTRPAGEEPLYC